MLNSIHNKFFPVPHQKYLTQEQFIKYTVSNRYVKDNSMIPISGGESLSTRWDFASRLSASTFDIIQPDICAVGGPSEMVKIGIMAQSLGVKFFPHFWGSGISFSAALDLAVKGRTQPSGYTEPILHSKRLQVKS